jgi:hypothetical protein
MSNNTRVLLKTILLFIFSFHTNAYSQFVLKIQSQRKDKKIDSAFFKFAHSIGQGPSLEKINSYETKKDIINKMNTIQLLTSSNIANNCIQWSSYAVMDENKKALTIWEFIFNTTKSAQSTYQKLHGRTSRIMPSEALEVYAVRGSQNRVMMFVAKPLRGRSYDAGTIVYEVDSLFEAKKRKNKFFIDSLFSAYLGYVSPS